MTLYSLSGEELSILLCPVGWLNDNIIFAARMLLKKQFQILGIQSTSFILTCVFKVHFKEFVQILHDGRGHWLTVMTIDWYQRMKWEQGSMQKFLLGEGGGGGEGGGSYGLKQHYLECRGPSAIDLL